MVPFRPWFEHNALMSASHDDFSAKAAAGRWRQMRRACLLCCALAAWALSQGVSAMPSSQAPLCAAVAGPLINVATLRGELDCVRVVDVREGDDNPLGPYTRGHVPGAVAAPYGRWRGDASNPGRLRSLAHYTKLVRSLGISADTPVVIVADGGDAADFGAPARVYWTLKWLGVRRLAILDGGMTAWTGARQAVSPLQVHVQPTSFQPQLDASIRARRASLADELGKPGAPLLLDARPRAYFEGQAMAPAAVQPGTMPGAQNLDFGRWFQGGGGRLADPAALRSAAQGFDARDGTVVSFCNTGHLAAINWFVLSEVLHAPHVQLYPGSMVDWSRAGEPMQNVPTRFQQLWAQLKQLLHTL